MHRALLACNFVVATSLVGCAADDLLDPSEEDAIADAAGAGKADAPEFPLGIFQAYDVEYTKDEGLHVAFHEDGSMDYTKFIDEGSETAYYTGTFKVYKYRGRDRLRLTDQSGRVVFRGDWELDQDGDLSFNNDAWLESTPDPNNVVNCTAFKVDDTSIFEEGFTEYEYPDFQIEKSGTSFSIQMGAGSLDPSDGTITVTQDAREILASFEDADGERVEIEIPMQAPRRGIITYSEEPTAPQHHMASLVCR